MFETPVVFIVFNRLDKSLQVFEKIRAMQPKQLFALQMDHAIKMKSKVACRAEKL